MKNILLLSVFTLFLCRCGFSGNEELLGRLAPVICECIEKTGVQPDSVVSNVYYKSCVVEHTRAFRKDIKKMAKAMTKAALKDDEAFFDNFEDFDVVLKKAVQAECPGNCNKIRESFYFLLE